MDIQFLYVHLHHKQQTSLTINFQSNENTHLQRGDKWQRLSVTLLRIKQCCNLHSNKCLRTRYVSWICGQVWSHPIFPVVSPAFRFWGYKFLDYKFLDYEVKDYYHYLRCCWSAGSRFSPCGSIYHRTPNPLEWFLALCLFALCKRHWEVWEQWTIIFRM